LNLFQENGVYHEDHLFDIRSKPHIGEKAI
jgi:hypothetical protein